MRWARSAPSEAFGNSTSGDSPPRRAATPPSRTGGVGLGRTVGNGCGRSSGEHGGTATDPGAVGRPAPAPGGADPSRTNPRRLDGRPVVVGHNDIGPDTHEAHAYRERLQRSAQAHRRAARNIS